MPIIGKNRAKSASLQNPRQTCNSVSKLESTAKLLKCLLFNLTNTLTGYPHKLRRLFQCMSHPISASSVLIICHINLLYTYI